MGLIFTDADGNELEARSMGGVMTTVDRDGNVFHREWDAGGNVTDLSIGPLSESPMRGVFAPWLWDVIGLGEHADPTA